MRLTYEQYLFSCLLKLYDKEFDELEYDLQFYRIPSLYKEFLMSDSNDGVAPLYECMEHYLINKEYGNK